LRQGWMLLFVALPALAGTMPPWWTGMSNLQRVECGFVQQSESAVFGNLERRGTLQLARGGRIRVSYTSGLLLVSDGSSLVQYDPAARTAQRFDLHSATTDMPLLNVLLDLKAVQVAYKVVAVGQDRLKLEPRRAGFPAVELEGRGAFLHRVAWQDSTGAKQVLVLKDPRVPSAPFPPSVFTFKAPEGTRWMGMK
jgi:outer membrane lipoprotein-sorting protein